MARTVNALAPTVSATLVKVNWPLALAVVVRPSPSNSTAALASVCPTSATLALVVCWSPIGALSEAESSSNVRLGTTVSSVNGTVVCVTLPPVSVARSVSV